MRTIQVRRLALFAKSHIDSGLLAAISSLPSLDGRGGLKVASRRR